MLRDAQYFNARIGRLDGAARLGDYLLQIVAEKKIQAQQHPASPAISAEALLSSASPTKAEEDVVVAEKS